MAPGAEATKIITDALPPSPALRVLTYNLWFSEHKGLEVVREKRMRAVSAIIEDACPDVIFFQELVPELYLYLAASRWFPDFVASSQPDAPPPGKDLYYTALFLRRATFTNISAFTFKLYPNSKMGRGLQLVTAEAFGAKWCLATSHLESPMWSEHHYMFHREREIQVKQALTHLDSYSQRGFEVVFGGDLNWIEEERGPMQLLPGWVDPWPVLRGADPGFTYDGPRNRMLGGWNLYQSRLDRFCVRLHAWAPARIALQGQSGIRGAFVLDFKDMAGKHLPILPSDHYGVALQLRPRGAGAAPAPRPQGPNRFLQTRGELRG